MSIGAGELNQKVDIQASASQRQAGGGTVKTWGDIATGVWAKVEPLNGGEAFRQGMLNATQLYRITIRFRTDVTPASRLIWNGTPLNIRTCAPAPDRPREALIITAESGAPEPV